MFTIMVEVPLRTAQATPPLSKLAHEGSPKPVAVPVETKLPQAAQAEGTICRQASKIRKAEIFFMFMDFSYGICPIENEPAKTGRGLRGPQRFGVARGKMQQRLRNASLPLAGCQHI